MVIVQVEDATGSVLDWMVASCENTLGRYVQPNEKRGTTKWEVIPQTLRYSTSYLHGSPIVEREGLTLDKTPDGWVSYMYREESPDAVSEGFGPTHLIAALRCYVASKLGDQVEVPDELI